MTHGTATMTETAIEPGPIKKAAIGGSSFTRQPLLYRMKLSPCEPCGLEEAGARVSDNPTRESSPASQSRWYLVQCRARQDERALRHLERQGFECYRPLYEKERIRRGRRELASVVLFPGYLFIRLDRIHDNWSPIRSTRGVIQIVRFNVYPLPVADGIIEQLRQRIATGCRRELHLQSGERVIVTEGSFSGIEAIFLAGDGEQRVILLLDLLHTEQRLSFPIRSVRKLGS
jgi:transcriptional antiterminator RfaH